VVLLYQVTCVGSAGPRLRRGRYDFPASAALAAPPLFSEAGLADIAGATPTRAESDLVSAQTTLVPPPLSNLPLKLRSPAAGRHAARPLIAQPSFSDQSSSGESARPTKKGKSS
jgi:hypothetical protein